ncbi:MAG: hypothetical protein ABI836_03560 [Gemmatimonadota bacterium]
MRLILRMIAGLVALVALMPYQVVAQQTIPLLRYQPPASWYRSVVPNPESYSSNEANAGVQVYWFRPINGDIQQLLQEDLLKRWIDPQFQESNVAAQPIFSRDSIPGAEAVHSVQFIENVAGVMHQHVRTILVARGYAAIMDAQAATPESWMRSGPTLQAMYRSLRVESAAAPPSVANGPGPLGRQIAGLYMGTKPKYVVNLNRPAGYGDHRLALHYYLFSADGHVYRCYDNAPDLQHFNFDLAAQEDPVNSGRYTVSNGQLFMLFGSGEQAEEITVPLPRGGQVTIETVLYQRQ